MTSTEPDLALESREVLACTRGGTLHIQGIGTLGPDGTDVLFYDDDGRPTFLAPANSPVTVAARRRRSAALSVPAGSDGGTTSTLLLAGHLAALGHEDVDGERIVVVGLLVHSVVLEHAPDAGPVQQRRIALADWTSARPDPMHHTARRIMRHTNQQHSDQVRTWVAGLRGVPGADVIAAELVDLDAHGVDVRWMDIRGAHRTRVRFARPAGCPGALAGALQGLLDSH